LTRTSTTYAPWYVVPADAKWFARIVVAAIIANKLVEMDPQFPTVGEEARQAMLVSRADLANECGGDAPDAQKIEGQPAEPKKKAKKKGKKK